ncbi:MAG: helix-turn-helix transcriptional regulator [Eubacteriales bacterium]|nr:helix-turn-helix transcriptional regulator [Eubacteriales bacterium]
MKNQKLILFRKEMNMSVSEMANRVGISESYYEKIEYGDRSPSYNFLTKFKIAFPESDAEDIFLSQNHTLCVEK